MPLTCDHGGDRLLVIVGQAIEIETAGKDIVGEALHIGDLLARQAGGAQVLVARPNDVGRVAGSAGRGLDPDEDCGSGLDADLLADDRPEHGIVAAIADPRLGIADPLRARI